MANFFRIRKTRFYFWIATALILLTSNAFSQKSFIATDSTIITGLELIEGLAKDNAAFIKVLDKGSIEIYGPDQLVSYGLNGGRIYFSKTLPTDDQKEVFLERLQEGKLNLYQYAGKMFYLEKDGMLMELDKHNYLDIIKEETSDCMAMDKPLRHVRRTRNSLARLFSVYNDCKLQPFPFLKFGISVGIGWTNLKVKNTGFTINWGPVLSGVSFKPDPAIYIGIFLDIPLAASDFSVNTSVHYSRNNYSSISVTGSGVKEAKVEFSSLDFPLLLRYTMPRNKIRPFFNFGGNLTFLFNETASINSIYNGYSRDIVGGANKDKLLNKNLTGFCGGGGFQFDIGKRNTLSFELRHSQFISTEGYFGKSAQVNLLVEFTL